tara:strand:+ start:244 stop:1344 length:1101 start_codon:yes stop_codon:yes gene_type:complete
MANVLLRSPYYISQDIGTDLSAKIEITIDSVLAYTIVKNKPSNSTFVLFEIAELVRDYIDIKYNGSITPSDLNVNVSYVLNKYTLANAGGTPTNLGTTTFFGIDGYGYFEEGSNPSVTKGYMQSNDIIYTLNGEDIRIPVDRNNTTSVSYFNKGSQVFTEAITSSLTEVFHYTDAIDSFKERVVEDSGTYEESSCIDSFIDSNSLYSVDEIRLETPTETKIVKVITLDECKYEPIKLTFVNRFGALQDLWFFKKSIEKVNTKKETFNRFTINSNTGVYDTSIHQNQTFNVSSSKKLTINTGYVDDSYNSLMQELMQSEQIWMELNSVVTPINLDTNSLTFKTGVNDKLVDYTVEVSYSFDAINNIR